MCVCVTVLQVMADFHQTSKRVPFEYLFDLIPQMQPRAFSIASSPQVTSTANRICLLLLVHSFYQGPTNKYESYITNNLAEYKYNLSVKMLKISIAFSIISLQCWLQAHPQEVQLLMAVVRYRTKLHTPRQGVCSTWLSTLTPDPDCKVPLWVKPGTITFPKDPTLPVVMVGPGRKMVLESCRSFGEFAR